MAVFTIIGAIVSVASFWIALQRYRREVVRKQLSYFVKTTDSVLATIFVWNSGNVPIEQADYISNSFGFHFGDDAQISHAHVEYQAPEDLGVDVTIAAGGRAEVTPVFLNPGDRYKLRVLLAQSAAQYKPRPFGRVRGTHVLFKEEKPETRKFGEIIPTTRSRGTRMAVVITVVIGVVAGISALFSFISLLTVPT